VSSCFPYIICALLIIYEKIGLFFKDLLFCLEEAKGDFMGVDFLISLYLGLLGARSCGISVEKSSIQSLLPVNNSFLFEVGDDITAPSSLLSLPSAKFSSKDTDKLVNYINLIGDLDDRALVLRMTDALAGYVWIYPGLKMQFTSLVMWKLGESWKVIY
jgi:hypothetical protein